MFKYAKKLFGHVLMIFFVFAAAVANWFLPLTLWLGDTPIYRFLWLGIFFVLLDVVFEIIHGSMKQMRLIADAMGFGRDLKKLGKGFSVLPGVKLPNNAVADYMVVGSSGVWLVTVRDGNGKVGFNGDDLVQGQTVLKGSITQPLEKAFTLAELLKGKLNRDFKVAAVVAFIGSGADITDVPNMVRGVYITSRQKVADLIGGTDVQILDTGIMEEIIKLLKK